MIKKQILAVGVWALMGLMFAFCTFGGAATAQTPSASVQVSNATAQAPALSAEARLFLAQWQPLRQKSITELEAESLYAELRDRYGLMVLTDENTKSQTLVLPVWLTFFSAEAAEPALRAAAELGFKVQTQLKTICTGLLPIDHLEAVSQIEGVRQVQVSQRVNLNLNLMRKATKLDSVQNFNVLSRPNWPSIRGEGVIVGVVDGGIEYVHPNFYDADSVTHLRIKRVWSQGESRATPPEGYDYGSEYATLDDIENAEYSRDNETHGTHVSGIAAGNGAGTEFVGAASKADLVVVPTTLMTENVLDGIQYIRRYAKEVGKPCVVNLSLGYHVGPHDGTSDFDRAMDEMKEPGFVVVGAAGNEGQKPIYVGCDFTSADTVFHTQLKFDQISKNTVVDVWSRDSTPLSVEVKIMKRTDGTFVDSTGFYAMNEPMELTKTLRSKGGSVEVNMIPEKNEFNGKYHMMMDVDARTLTMGSYAEYIVCLSVKTNAPHPAAHVDMWANTGEFTRFQHATLPPEIIVGGSSRSTMGEIGGTSKSILTVGSYNTRNAWKSLSGIYNNYDYMLPLDTLSYFSSHGPTADGRVKPDITAPGAYIVSSFNSHFRFDRNDQVATVYRNSENYPFGVMMGTSMATPAVTGIVALCLQLRPDWQVDSLRYHLSLSALNDRYTGSARTAPNYDWGYGKIDALALLCSALRGLTNASDEELQEAVEGRRLLVYPNPNQGHFYTLLPNENREVRLQVLDQAGRVVCERRATADGSPLEWSLQNLSKGLYIVRMEGNNTHTAKFIIQ